MKLAVKLAVVRVLLALCLLANMSACEEEEGEPNKKTEPQNPVTTPNQTGAPQPEPSDDTLAVAVSSNPANLDLAEKFTLIVTIDKGAPVKYRYHLLDEEKGNCSVVTQKVEQRIGISSEIAVGGNGGKTLCVWGVDSDGNEQQVATTLEWEKFSPDAEVLAPTDENAKPEKPKPEPKPKAIMRVSNLNFVFDSAVDKVYEVDIENIGTADLEWRVHFEIKADGNWLAYSLDADVNRQYEVAKGKMITGTLEPKTKKTLYLRVKDIFKTDYAMPYNRELVVRFGNIKSGWTRAGKATLRIPKADISVARLDLHRDGRWVRAYVNNIGNPKAEYFLQLIRVEGIKNHDYVMVAGPFHETGNRNNVYFKFSQRTDRTPPSKIFVAYAVYTNGDSYNYGDCQYYKVGDKLSDGHGKPITFRYNSNACKGIILFPDLDS